MQKSLNAMRSFKKSDDESKDQDKDGSRDKKGVKDEPPAAATPKAETFADKMRNRFQKGGPASPSKADKEDKENKDDGKGGKKGGAGKKGGKGSDDEKDDDKKKGKDDDDSDDDGEADDDEEGKEEEDGAGASPDGKEKGGRKKRGGDRDKKKKGGKESSEADDNASAVESGASLGGFMRKPPSERLERRLRERVRVVAEQVPEVHFVGEIIGGSGFAGNGTSVKWTLEYGKYWDLLSGDAVGQSQYASGDSLSDLVAWNHPLDLHLATSSMQGWPRLRLQVWELDEYGRTNLSGYGFAHLPVNPGCYDIAVACWRPTGSLPEEIQAFFLGANPQLANEEVLFSKAWENRCRLVTVPSGKVHIQVSVINRFFMEQGVDMNNNA